MSWRRVYRAILGREGSVAKHRRSLARTPWRTISTRPVYVNPWVHVREDIAEMPDGRRTLYGVITTRPAIGVLPFLDDDTVVLVGQYRYVAHAFHWEIPTGAMTEGEHETDAAQRELAEEAGYRAGRLEKLCTFDTSKSVLDETAHLYVATELVAVEQEPDATEFIEVRSFPFDEILAMVRRSEIVDGMTVVAVLHAAQRRR
jgi:ADP-ribose pyrophosphatase